MHQEKKGSLEARSATEAAATWRALSVEDIENLARVADAVHPGLPERDEVFAERVKLFPEGCLALENKAGELCGYIISHPIRHRQPPALDSLLEEIASDANQYYIHDIAILPRFRGGGFALEGIKKILAVTRQFPTCCLVSVYGTATFWNRFGFEKPEDVDQVLQEKLMGYGDDAMYLECQVY